MKIRLNSARINTARVNTARMTTLGVLLTLGSALLGGCGAVPGAVKPTVPAVTTTPKPATETAAQGAFFTGQYRNLFKEANPALTDTAVNQKIQATWDAYFASTDPNTQLYYPAGRNANGPLGYVLDVNDNDVRSEGVSYGMMLAVQMDKKETFDAIWNWTATYLRQQSGPWKGYFAWHARTDGTQIDANPAPDGEEYLAAALFFASGRWGDGQGIYNYRARADEILNVMLHKEDQAGGVVEGVTNMFGSANQVVFVPWLAENQNGFTDPSYHLPAFYELFSRWASGYQDQGADRKRWATIAATSREVLWPGSTHPTTGLNPDYSGFDGKPYARTPGDGHDLAGYDSWRVAMNWGVDAAWFAAEPKVGVWADRLQAFLAGNGVDSFSNVYTVAGVAQDTYHDSGHVAMVATAGLATTQSRAYDFTNALWAAPKPSGQYRYYSGLLYLFGLLNNAGQYRIYAPAER